MLHSTASFTWSSLLWTSTTCSSCKKKTRGNRAQIPNAKHLKSNRYHSFFFLCMKTHSSIMESKQGIALWRPELQSLTTSITSLLWNHRTLENVTLDETVTSTDCRGTGLEAFATGVTIWASTYDVRGIQFICAEVTPTCLPRRYPSIQTPAPSAPSLASPEESAPLPTAGAQSETGGDLDASLVAPCKVAQICALCWCCRPIYSRYKCTPSGVCRCISQDYTGEGPKQARQNLDV